ncbi:MAG: exosortase H-associated membrane protein [Xanthomonadales bacterium]|nr:exosortase H-associated membrane protein [Xanthomonadales bacterium]
MSASEFSLKAFMLNVVLWLPLAFFLWFYLAPVLVAPVGWGVSGILALWPGELFHGVVRDGYWLQVGVLLDLPEGLAIADIPVNPMLYGYGLPLIVGLVVSTPLAARHRLLQLLAGYLLVAMIQIWGVIWECFRTLAFEMGEPGMVVQRAAGLPSEVIALAYQFGYLILPAVVPVAAWILFNRRFIEGVVNLGHETTGPPQGQ